MLLGKSVGEDVELLVRGVQMGDSWKVTSAAVSSIGLLSATAA